MSWSEVLGDVIRAGSLCIAALFLLAIAHKAQALAGGTQFTTPLIHRIAVLRSYPRAALSAAAATELVLVVLVLIVPAVGLGAMAVLLVGYATALRAIDLDESCACFGEFFEAAGRSGAVLRNALLAAFAGTGSALALAGAVTISAPSDHNVGAALVVSAVLLALDALRRTSNRREAMFASAERR